MGCLWWLWIFLFSWLPAAACKWDRDTLAEEAKHGLDSVKACVGWFDRYPPRYYEMRLERVTAELAANPAALELYDDAGVACDRLGRYDQAIDWMAKKNAVLDRRPPAETAEHRYRYLANLGSFFMDRWIARPAAEREADLTDLQEAEKRIAAAIELNPAAHFGRERYQLQMIRWLLFKGPADDFDSGTFLEGRAVDPLGSDEEAVAGLTGLVLLGEGWGSIDVFNSLQAALVRMDQNVIAQLACRRALELAADHPSLHPRAEMRKKIESGSFIALRSSYWSTVDGYFQQARAASDARVAAWRIYQEERFAEGKHPDTDPAFWAAWQEPAFPALPGLTWGDWLERHEKITLTGSLMLVAMAVVVPYLLIKRILRWAGVRDLPGSGRRRSGAPKAFSPCPVPSSASTSPSPPMARSPRPPDARPAGPPPPITRG